jgi:hypothetical protein
VDRTWGRLGRLLLDGARAAAAGARTAPQRSRRRSRPAAPAAGRTGQAAHGAYPGDFTGTAVVEYAPAPDDRADPGEVVWGWVTYEEDHTRGKDRPALVVGRDGRWVLALMLTSRDHDADPAGGRGQDWLDVGSGAWDGRGRPSEVRLDRVLRLDPDGIRREGARLDRAVFDRVAAALRERHGWS